MENQENKQAEEIEKVLEMDIYGVITLGSEEIVCQGNASFEYITDPEFEINENDIVEYSIDGTCIRLYYSESEWRTATKNVIDGRNSRWSSEKSFDTLFWELVSLENSMSQTHREIFESRKPGFTFTFIIEHSENQIVLPVENQKLTLTQVQENVTYSDIKVYREQPYIMNVSRVGQVHVFNNRRGVIVKRKNEWCDYTFYLYDFPIYNDRRLIRGNCKDIGFRYCQLINKPSKLAKFIAAFPEGNMNKYFSELHKRDKYISKKRPGEIFNAIKSLMV